MNHRIILPAINLENTRECVASMRADVRSRVILIDNTDDASIAEELEDEILAVVANRHNGGVAASWNTGLRKAFAGGAYSATLCSASMRFGPRPTGREGDVLLDGGEALIDIADFCEANTQWPWGFESRNGWHLITIGRRLFDEVGEFDENFWPAYYEDNDYIWRARCAGILEPVGAPRHDRKTPWVPTLRYPCVGDGLALKSGVEVDLEQLAEYYASKWGGRPGDEQWTHPFNGGTVDDRFGHDFSYPVVPHG